MLSIELTDLSLSSVYYFYAFALSLSYRSILRSAFLTFSFSGRFPRIYKFYLSSSSWFFSMACIFTLIYLITLPHSASINCFSFRILSICWSCASNKNWVYRSSSSNVEICSYRLLFAFFSSEISKFLESASTFYFLIWFSSCNLIASDDFSYYW